MTYISFMIGLLSFGLISGVLGYVLCERKHLNRLSKSVQRGQERIELLDKFTEDEDFKKAQMVFQLEGRAEVIDELLSCY